MFRSGQMGVYIHWPFCASKCPYCDFNSHVREQIDETVWLQAYIKCLEYYADIVPKKEVVSIFFGGGTPSLMSPNTVGGIIDSVQRLWSIANDVEITLEANPTSVDIKKFEGFRDAGVNRISLGVQAMNDRDLRFLGREHNVDDALTAIDVAGKVFDRYSFDLIYARPQQSLRDWEEELKKAVQYSRGHLSLYQLTIERNTPFYMRYNRGEFDIPDDVLGADFYHLAQDILENAGLPAYEVSNHALSGGECRHNLIYWNMADYIGVGAGAHGRFKCGGQKIATRDHSAPEIWLERIQMNRHGAHPSENLTSEDCFLESVMMGLRLCGGLSTTRCEEISGVPFFDMIDESNFTTAIQQGWISHQGDSVSLTREGILRLNALISYILK